LEGARKWNKNMNPLELALTSLSEATAVTLHRSRDSHGFTALKRDTTDAGATTGKARRVIESDIGGQVVSSENYLHLKKVKESPKKSGRVLPNTASTEHTFGHTRQQHQSQQPPLFDKESSEE
jgi:hypothetical protein